MGILDREYYRDDLPRPPIFGESMRVCLILIGLFTICFFVQVSSREPIGPSIGQRVFAPGEFTETLDLRSDKVFSGELWRLVTYAVLHDAARPFAFLPFLLTALLLVWPGRHVEDELGQKSFIGFCLLVAVVNGLGYAIAGWIFGINAPLAGPSGMMTGILFLYALRHPRRVVLLAVPVPIWFFPAMYLMLDSVAFFGPDPRPLAVAGNLAAIATAMLYHLLPVFQLGRSTADSTQNNSRRKAPVLRLYHEGNDTATPEEAPVPVSSTPPVPKTAPPKTAPAPAPSATLDAELEARMDTILAKMNQYGKESITEEEWAILRRASEVCKKKRQQG